LKKALASYNAGVVAVNKKIVGLAPGNSACDWLVPTYVETEAQNQCMYLHITTSALLNIALIGSTYFNFNKGSF
jgi:hypothetical protein